MGKLFSRKLWPVKFAFLVYCCCVVFLFFLAPNTDNVGQDSTHLQNNQRNFMESRRTHFCNSSLPKDFMSHYSNFTRQTVMFQTAYFSEDLPEIGQWKSGLKYNESCIMQGRDYQSSCCDDKAKKMHFVFHNKSIQNSKKALNVFLSKVRGKKVILFGDSLQRNFFSGLAEVLQLGRYFSNNSDGHEFTNFVSFCVL